MGLVGTERITVEVEGRQLSLSNLDKILYPDHGFTKGEVVDYYTRIAPTLLPHLAGRPLTVKRFPNGVDAPSFFEKNAARGTPNWVRTVSLPVPGSTKDRDRIDYVIVEEVATLVWLANLAALELHVPQWQVPAGKGPMSIDEIVFDLDPGKPAAIAECGEVALLLREALVDDGLKPVVKTSGSKGIQVSAPVEVSDLEATSSYARALAEQLERARPDLVVSRMAKSLRGGKVLVDWSQNNPAKTTVAPYSLRARPRPTVSTPVSWDEVASGKLPAFTAADVLERVEADGDLFAGALANKRRRPLPAEPSSEPASTAGSKRGTKR
jgi:bifunctional non-homologous end joining protein LigD